METIKNIIRWGMTLFLVFFGAGLVLVLLGCFTWPDTLVTQVGLGLLAISVACGAVVLAAVITGAVKLIKK